MLDGGARGTCIRSIIPDGKESRLRTSEVNFKVVDASSLSGTRVQFIELKSSERNHNE